MELVFHKENGLYITEFEVTSDFNVHLERSKGGKVSFYQKTTDGNYDHIEKLSKNIDKVFDYDFQALVYPKIIKITSECEFDVASLTTDGEVTEIKSQSKEVEITANGVTEIAPDAGFGYLSGVKVNVNVPQSGEGGSAPSGGSELKYFVPPVELRVFGLWATLCKLKDPDKDSVAGIMPSSLYITDGGTSAEASSLLLAFAVDTNMEVWLEALNKIVTWRELMEIMNGEDLVADLTEITKEEFYDVNNLHQ
jgi:hypothetical protein